MTDRGICTVCTAEAVVPFLRIENAPISCNHLCASREAALSAPRTSISLAFCPDCGHVFNIEYDSARLEYRPGYENSLRGSARFGKYDDALRDALIERYRLHGRVIVDLGCGQGDFLRALCERGGNSGIGFDPSYLGEDNQVPRAPGIVIHSGVYGEHAADLNADFICSRHTLEHVANPREFLSSIRRGTRRFGMPLFFEVPNGLYTLRDGGIWDIIYEHCSYFTPTSLSRVFWESGYKPLEVSETFSGQFLTIHAMTDASKYETPRRPARELELLVDSFAQRYHATLKQWASSLLRLEAEGRRVVIWGAGAKGATFLNLLRPPSVEFVVDVNPRKHGKYVVGTGQLIVPPDFILEYKPDEIICMNPNYVEEISRQAQTFGLRPHLMSA